MVRYGRHFHRHNLLCEVAALKGQKGQTISGACVILSVRLPRPTATLALSLTRSLIGYRAANRGPCYACVSGVQQCTGRCRKRCFFCPCRCPVAVKTRRDCCGLRKFLEYSENTTIVRSFVHVNHGFLNAITQVMCE